MTLKMTLKIQNYRVHLEPSRLSPHLFSESLNKKWIVDTWFWTGFGILTPFKGESRNSARHVQTCSNVKCYFYKENQPFRHFFVQIIERCYIVGLYLSCSIRNRVTISSEIFCGRANSKSLESKKLCTSNWHSQNDLIIAVMIFCAFFSFLFFFFLKGSITPNLFSPLCFYYTHRILQNE